MVDSNGTKIPQKVKIDKTVCMTSQMDKLALNSFIEACEFYLKSGANVVYYEHARLAQVKTKDGRVLEFHY